MGIPSSVCLMVITAEGMEIENLLSSPPPPQLFLKPTDFEPNENSPCIL